MTRRPRRWAPREPGFRRIRDSGTTAIWMRLEPDRTVTAVVYLEAYGHKDGVWTINARRGSYALGNIMDKPHRVTQAWGDHNDDGLFGTPVAFKPLPETTALRRPPKLRGRRFEKRAHARWWRRRDPWDPYDYGVRESLPRKFREQEACR